MENKASRKTKPLLKISLIALTITLLLAGCMTTSSEISSPRHRKSPVWLEDKNRLYPPEKYLAELGEGSSLKQARENARTAMARIFKTTIIADSRVKTRYRDLADGKTILKASMETEADESISQLSRETLINLHFGESWTSPEGRVYTIAWIDRLETAGIYRQRIEREGLQVQEFMERAKQQNSPLKHYGYLDGAMLMDQHIQSMTAQLEILYSPFARSILLPYERKELTSLHNDALDSMIFSITIKGDPEGKVRNMTALVLTERGFTVSESDGTLQVSGQSHLEPVILDNSYENIRWNLSLEMKNEEGHTVVYMDERSRVSGISPEEAEVKAYKAMKKAVKKNFTSQFNSYINTLLGN